MKRCPTCNQVFTEEWLSFCTQDGTSLIDTSALPQEPPPTMMAPPMPPSVSPAEQPTMNLPGAYGAPDTQPGSVQFGQPFAAQPVWQPPPPPKLATSPQQGLAIASLICGIFSVTIGWCCYMGVITGPVAIGLGIFSLAQIKKDPTRHGGKPLAIGGIVTGALYFVFLVLIILLYGMAFMMGGIK